MPDAGHVGCLKRLRTYCRASFLHCSRRLRYQYSSVQDSADRTEADGEIDRAKKRELLTMAQQGGVMPGSGTSGSLSWMPLVVSALVVAHVFALVFWIYKLATDKPEDRRKVH